MRKFVLVLMVASLVLAAVGGFAQSTGGRIIGQVTDASKAVIPNAKITLINEETGVIQSTQSDGGGTYSFPQVPLGRFTITAESAGFKKEVQKGIELSLNQVLTLPMTLQPGAVTEEVTVTGATPLVDTTSTQLGTSVDAKTVVSLPLNSRDTYQLLQIQPGVTSVGGSDLFAGSDSSGAVSVNGGRGRSNNFSVNGGDANDLFVNAPAVQPSPDSIQEFRVITNTFDAEYGRNSGAVVNVVTKSGTNKLHGSIYEFFGHESLNAKGYFDRVRRPDFTQNQYGGTFGAPIKKDKTFIFLSYEARRVLRGETTDPAVVPSFAERNGDFSKNPDGTPVDPLTGIFSGVVTDQAVADILNARCGAGAIAGSSTYASLFPGNQIPIACFDPVALSILNRYVPLPNEPDNHYQAVPNGHEQQDQASIKFDHSFNQNNQLSIYYYIAENTGDKPVSHFESPSPNVLPGFGTQNDTRTQQASASYTWTINPRAINEFRFSWFRNSQGKFLHPVNTESIYNSCGSGPAAAFCFTGLTDTSGQGGNPPVFDPNSATYAQLGITPGLGASREGLPFISVSGGFTIGNNFEGEIPQTGNTYQWSDNLTKIWGNHTLKFGGDVRHQVFDQTLYFDVNGDFGYFGGGLNDVGFTNNLFPNYLIGLPDSYLQGSAQNSRYRSEALYLFAQDSWKIKPNFTVNYGLRWELNTPFRDLNKRVQTFRPGQPTTTYPCTSCGPTNELFPTGLVVQGDRGVPAGLTETFHGAFAPRIGFAWSPNATNKFVGGPGKMSIRTGFGIFYNPIEQLVLEQLGAQPPFGGSSLISEGFFQAPFALQSCTEPCATGQFGVNPNPFGGFQSPAPGTSINWSNYRPILLFGTVPQKEHAQYTMQYNFTVQRELAKDWGLTLSYVGSQSRHLLATRDLNFGNAQTCLDLNAVATYYAPFLADGVTPNPNSNPSLNSAYTCGPFFADSPFSLPANSIPAGFTVRLPYGNVPTIGPGNPLTTLVGLRPFSSPQCQPTTGVGCPTDGIPVFSSIFSQGTNSNAVYNAFEASLEKKFSKGLQFMAAYTLSKSEDDVSSFEQLLNPICNSCNRSLSLFDARQRLVFSYVWEFPVPKYSDKRRYFLNGWSMSGITTFQSGFPIRIDSSDDSELQNSVDFEYVGKPDQVGPFRTFDPRQNGGYYFDPGAFQTAAIGTLGTAKRTICCGPGVKQWDVSFLKDTKLGERVNMQFRAEFFNIFNTVQFLNPDGNLSDGVDFGRVKRARAPRNIQFALKFAF